jgi:hypothetical protein
MLTRDSKSDRDFDLDGTKTAPSCRTPPKCTIYLQKTCVFPRVLEPPVGFEHDLLITKNNFAETPAEGNHELPMNSVLFGTSILPKSDGFGSGSCTEHGAIRPGPSCSVCGNTVPNDQQGYHDVGRASASQVSFFISRMLPVLQHSKNSIIFWPS